MLRVRVLGELAIELDDTAFEQPPSKRARALLGWLALDRGMHARSRLAARFWPDVLDESARTSLRSALSALRRALGPDGERYLLATRDEVGLADESLVWTDLGEFDRRVAEGRLEEALELSRGELLAGLDDDWVYERRDEHRDRVAGVLARLAADAEHDGDIARAIDYTRRQVALDPLAEDPQRELMRRLAAGGDRASAIRTYERLSRRFRDELRILPSQATRALAEELRHGGDVTPPEPATLEVSPAPTSAPDAPVAAAIVTLLFTDLVGSTALLSQLGDDEAERLRRIHFGLLREVAMAHSGQEVKNLGDGLMVAFPSAVNAVGCAIEIQQAVHRHNARHADDRLQVRVGLNVGEPIRDEGDYFGTPVVVAKRLCDAADGGQILASELVRGLVGSRGGFDFRPGGPVALKGLPQPLAVCEIGWEPAVEHRVSLPPPLIVGEPGALVGRGAELEELNRLWRDVRGGRRAVTVIVGEPGIGKTRLAAEFCGRAYAQAAAVLLGRCYEDSIVPYQPFVEALRHHASETPLDELRLQVGRHRPVLARLVPELADPAPQSITSATGGSLEGEQFQLFESVASMLRAIAEEHPLILVLDDLHWADTPTLLLLRHVVRATEGSALLILGTFRQTEVDEAHPLGQAIAELRRARAFATVVLGGLGEGEVAQLIASQLSGAAPATVARSIVERTQGNPFFVEELLRDIGSDGDISDALTRIPDSVKDLLLRRLRRLDEGCKRLLNIAAVAGHEFALDILKLVAGGTEEEIAEGLEQAIGAQVIHESPTAMGEYSFAHALIRETIYDQISLTRRAQLHRRIAEAIEGALGEAAQQRAASLAYHFSAAGDVRKAYDYHSKAAAAAARVYAVESALAHYTSAVDAGTMLGLDRVREPALRGLLLQRARMRWRTGDMSGAEQDLEAVLAAAQRAGDRASELETLNELGIISLRSDLGAASSSHEAALEIARELGDTPAETNALDRLSVICSHRLQLDRALELGERALGLARRTNDDIVIGRAIDSIKLAALQLGDLRQLQVLTAELEPLWRERGDLWYLQWTLLESAFVPLGTARWEEADDRLAAATAINRRVHDPHAEMLILDASCWLNRSRGAYQDALDAGRQAVALAAKVGWEGWAAATLGTTLLDLRAAGPAARVLERGVAAGERIGAPNEIARCLGQLAWARCLLGDADETGALCARARELLEGVSAPQGGAFVFGAHAYTAVARVLLATGLPEQGEELLLPVFRAAQRSDWREAAACTGLVVGLCAEGRGDLEQARERLAHAAGLADQYGIPAVGWEAHAAMARLLDEHNEHRAAARAIVERVAGTLNDDELRDGLRLRAFP
jgi:predicted ATPase/class 3 adenylate cyclase